jgi:hypothetical protein
MTERLDGGDVEKIAAWRLQAEGASSGTFISRLPYRSPGTATYRTARTVIKAEARDITTAPVRGLRAEIGGRARCLDQDFVRFDAPRSPHVTER